MVLSRARPGRVPDPVGGLNGVRPERGGPGTVPELLQVQAPGPTSAQAEGTALAQGRSGSQVAQALAELPV